jgi:hypothetical protein
MAFDRELGYDSIGKVDDPTYRMEIARTGLLKNFHRIATNLHQTVTVRHYENDSWLSGRLVEKRDNNTFPMSRIHGLDLVSDIGKHVLPTVETLYEDISENQPSENTALARMATISGLVIAQGQVFSDGNTRVGRAMHDFIRDGREGLTADGVFDWRRNFDPPEIIEDLVMKQNVTRLMTVDVPEYQPVGGIYVPYSVEDAYARSAELFERFYHAPNASNVIPFESAEHRRQRRSDDLGARLRSMTDLHDGTRDNETFLTLRQKKYGPAAWTVAFPNETPPLPLSRENAARLQQADSDLLRMRLISLISGAAIGGQFTAIESVEGSTARMFRHIPWVPEASQ